MTAAVGSQPAAATPAASRPVARAARTPHDLAASIERAWEALAAVPDPEIPMVSVVELGIVRDIRIEDGAIVVAVTPTYSGCPATDVITRSIEAALAAADCPGAKVITTLAPPWTTDWMAPEGKRKLATYGIAPPGTPAPRIDVAGISPLRRLAVAVACPRCASTRTRLIAQFGSTACKAHYRCDACLEPFDYFKPH